VKIRLLCVGTRMPEWVEAAVEEYRKRLPREFELQVQEVPLAQRGKTVDEATLRRKEGEALLKLTGKTDYVAALDVRGKSLSTEALAEAIRGIRDSGRSLCLLIGGPDGLSEDCLERAEARWSLSALTFAHPIVRVLLAEQLYRVWSLLQGHPYHRG
jgi:23S rRNA (pseudouridine1915-N3)-methyltransferase